MRRAGWTTLNSILTRLWYVSLFLLAVCAAGKVHAADTEEVRLLPVSFLMSDAKIVPAEDAAWIPTPCPIAS